MSYIKTLKNGEIRKKKTKNSEITPYDAFVAKKRPSTTPYKQKLTITTPKNFVDAEKIIDEVQSKNGVIFDLKNLSPVDVQRTLDFLSGAVYSIKATLKRIDEDKYLITPPDMRILSSLDS